MLGLNGFRDEKSRGLRPLDARVASRRIKIAAYHARSTQRSHDLSLVSQGMGTGWVNETSRWRWPERVVVLPVIDLNMLLPLALVEKGQFFSPVATLCQGRAAIARGASAQ